ncbi:MAG: MATE family efflux transporter [Woeseiaceae bacterium]|nr:MATE family efflux transporter [Woeseiaceae bacterium]
MTARQAVRSPDSRDVWRIAAPLILSNVSVPLLGMVDTGVTGHLDDPRYLGAVAVGSALFSFLFIGFNFLRMGTTGVAAQQFGARDFDGLRSSLGQAVVTAIVVALALLLLQQPLGSIGLRLLGPDPNVLEHARTYFDIRIWSAPATLVNYVLIGWFIGLQNARIPLAIVVTTNLVNIALDLVFVIGMDMKVAGVATASVIAEATGALLGLYFVRKTLSRYDGEWRLPALTRIGEYRRFFSINANLFVRTIALVSTLTFVTAQGARLGGLVLAANAVLMNLQNLIAFVLDAVAHAAEALVGKALGENSKPALEAAVRLTLRWSVLMAVAFCALFAIAGPSLIRLLTDLPGIRQTALDYLPWMILSPAVSVWSFLYDGVFVGATRARDMRNIMVGSAILIFLPAWYLLQPLGNHGLWLAFTLFMAGRGVGMHVAYRTRVLPSVSGERVRSAAPPI